MDTIHKGITTLMASAVTGEKRQLPEGFTLESALPIIKKQHLTPLVFQGALNCGIPRQDPIMARMMQRYIAYMLQSEKQMRAAERLFAAFEENGIDYLPLKGVNMKSLYPKPELRLMGDADILIRFGQYERIEPIMTTLGYTMTRVGPCDHEWRCEDLTVELHRQLIPPEDTVLHAYFGDGWGRAVKGEGFRYHFSREDTFLYQFTHMAKHYLHNGIGSRHILDLYVYLRANPGMDEAYIEGEMAKLQLLDFYRNIRRTLRVWFEDAAPDGVTEHITAYVFSSGSFGTLENGISTDAVRQSQEKGTVAHSRIRALLTAVFPSAAALELKYPVLQKKPWLLPLVWVYRWFEVLLCRPGNIRRKMGAAASMTDEKVLQRRQALEYVGLTFEE